jgi:5-methylcytosine-specific restriction endonuclease McrA
VRPALKRLFLLAASTDTKAARTEGGFTAPCLHCRSTLALRADGEALGNATLEHVVPVSWFGKRAAASIVAGLEGPDDARNLALACRRCNHDKGTGPDARGPADAGRGRRGRSRPGSPETPPAVPGRRGNTGPRMRRER